MVGERCPNCEALVSPDAEWCGQCFEPLPSAASVGKDRAILQVEPDVRGGERPGEGGSTKVASWTCPVCGEANALELDACRICDTSFASLLRGELAPQDVDPRAAVKASLVFPGLGHRLLGRQADGLARGVLFAVALAMTLLLGLSGPGSGVLVVVLLIFAFATLILYVGTAFEAHRLAHGGNPLVSARALLWSTVALLVGSMLLIAFIGFTAATG